MARIKRSKGRGKLFYLGLLVLIIAILLILFVALPMFGINLFAGLFSAFGGISLSATPTTLFFGQNVTATVTSNYPNITCWSFVNINGTWVYIGSFTLDSNGDFTMSRAIYGIGTTQNKVVCDNNGFNITSNPVTITVQDRDSDGDGYTDSDEFQNGNDPNDPTDNPGTNPNPEDETPEGSGAECSVECGALGYDYGIGNRACMPYEDTYTIDDLTCCCGNYYYDMENCGWDCLNQGYDFGGSYDPTGENCDGTGMTWEAPCCCYYEAQPMTDNECDAWREYYSMGFYSTALDSDAECESYAQNYCETVLESPFAGLIWVSPNCCTWSCGI